jgi:hypothetical protein
MGRSPAAAARLQARTLPALAALVVGLLAASLTGAAVHHRSHHGAALGSLASDKAAIGLPAGVPGGSAASARSAGPSSANRAPTSSAAPAKAAPGDVLLIDQADGITLSVPAGWRALPVESNALAGALRSVTASSPQLAPLLSQPEGYAATGYLRLLAVHTGGDAMAVSMITTPAPNGVTLDQLAQTSLSNASQTTAQGVSVQKVALPAGQALQVTLKVPFSGQMLVLTQDLLIHKGHEIVVQVGTVTASPTDAVLNRILGSIRFR